MKPMTPDRDRILEAALKRIGQKAPLKKEPPRLEEAIMARIMRQQAAEPAFYRRWGALAGAAALLIVGFAVGRLSLPDRGSQKVPVQFVLEAAGASSVSVVGDFTDWQPVSLRRRHGRWELAMKLPANRRFEYGFILNGRVFVVDPRASSVEADRTGQYYAVLDTGKRTEI